MTEEAKYEVFNPTGWTLFRQDMDTRQYTEYVVVADDGQGQDVILSRNSLTGWLVVDRPYLLGLSERVYLR